MHAYKTYKDFAEGITEICEISPAISDLMKSTDGSAPSDPIGAAKVLVENVHSNIPSVYSENYPFTPAFSISAFEVGYKFPGQLSFGWRTNVPKDGSDVEFKFRITMSSNDAIASNSEIMKTAKDYGFNLVRSADK